MAAVRSCFSQEYDSTLRVPHPSINSSQCWVSKCLLIAFSSSVFLPCSYLSETACRSANWPARNPPLDQRDLASFFPSSEAFSADWKTVEEFEHDRHMGIVNRYLLACMLGQFVNTIVGLESHLLLPPPYPEHSSFQTESKSSSTLRGMQTYLHHPMLPKRPSNAPYAGARATPSLPKIQRMSPSGMS